MNNRINQQIKVPKVRVIIDGKNDIYDTSKAINLAKEKGLDLIEIVPNSKPPVCKIMDFDKYQYEQKKRKQDLTKKQRENEVVVKEIRLSPNIGEHDMKFKARHAKNFLKKNNKVKVTLTFKGRDNKFKERGEIVLLEFAKILEDYGIPESMPKSEKNKMFFTFKPLKK